MDMQRYTDFNEPGSLNGLISPALTPVTEEPPHDADHELQVLGNTHNQQSSSRNRDNLRLLAPPISARARASSLPSSPQAPQWTFGHALDGANDVAIDGILKLSPAKLNELAVAQGSLPLRRVSPVPEEVSSLQQAEVVAGSAAVELVLDVDVDGITKGRKANEYEAIVQDQSFGHVAAIAATAHGAKPPNKLGEELINGHADGRPSTLARSVSVPFTATARTAMPDRMRPARLSRKSSTRNEGGAPAGPAIPPAPPQLHSRVGQHSRAKSNDNIPRATAHSLQLPPLSIPAHLYLELSSNRPAAYVNAADSQHAPYESLKVKFERLRDFFLLPPQLEQVLLFGACCCLDAWLYEFTILPLRFIKAFWILLQWIFMNIISEIRSVVGVLYWAPSRLWTRRRPKNETAKKQTANGVGETVCDSTDTPAKESFRKRIQTRIAYTPPLLQTKPSLLQASHKADLLEGLLIIVSCTFLMRFDASRMYHAIRGQAAIKLYVIYNALEVFDRLFSALGQDIMECLFSAENLERKSNGRSRIIQPLWMFLLALVYTTLHATAFFYQVITLNVAVNSYSNALLTLLMSNQFVEIKGTVFKKIEKENFFQLTCADIIERFQLWLMLFIIVLRNIIELGGLSVNSNDFAGPSSTGSTNNPTTSASFRTFGILPNAFTIFPSLFPAQVLMPFLLVLGSEMLVDWLKHAYITKFNAMSHKIYGRFLDVLAKDYYSNAFAEQGLTRRLGLPVIPLTCLFIRATVQTYHMILATTNVTSGPPVASFTTSLSTDTADAATSPIIHQIDAILRSALGRSSFFTFSTSSVTSSSTSSFIPQWIQTFSLNDAIAVTTLLAIFLTIYLLLLVLKLSLGMALLKYATTRYKGMKARERQSYVHSDTKRLGGWGVVEVGEERRRTIYEGDERGYKVARDREEKMGKGGDGNVEGDKLDSVKRYSMVAKRIW